VNTAYSPGQHIAGADPHHSDDAGEDEEDDNDGQQGSRRDALARRLVSRLDPIPETRLRGGLVGHRLHCLGCLQGLARRDGAVGNQVLRQP
jgi:hypothetical protein